MKGFSERISRWRLGICVALLSCLIQPAFAQVHEEMKVILREIRVHVVDKDGNPVKGLKKDDFLVEEEKQPRDLSVFEEVDLTTLGRAESDDEAIEETPPRVFGLVIDSCNMPRRSFPEMIKQLKRFVEEELRPVDLVKILQFEGGMTHLTSFTTDRYYLMAALDRARYVGSLRSQLDLKEDELMRAYENYRRADYRSRPMHLMQMETLLDEKDRLKARYFTAFQDGLTSLIQIMSPMTGDKTILLATGGSYLLMGNGMYSSTSEAQQLVSNLNAGNITLHALFTGTREPVGSLGRLTSPYLSPHARVRLPATGRELFENTFDLEQGPLELAESTGGFYEASFHESKIDEELEDLADRANHYYRVGYTVNDEGRKTRVKVSIKNEEKGWTVRYGARFQTVPDYRDLKEPQKTLTFETLLLYSQSFRDDLQVDLGAGLFLSREGGMVVPVFLDFDPGVVPESGYEVGFAVLSESREVLDITRTTVTTKEAGARLCLYDVLLPDRKPKFIRASVRDMDLNLFSLAEYELDATLFPSGRSWVTQPILSAIPGTWLIPVNQLREVEKKRFRKKEAEMAARDQQRKINDPMVLGDKFFMPAFRQRVTPQPQINLLVHFVNVGGLEDDRVVVLKAIQEKREIVLENELIAKLQYDKTLRCHVQVDTSDLPVGTWDLTVNVQNESGETLAVSAPLTLNWIPPQN